MKATVVQQGPYLKCAQWVETEYNRRIQITEMNFFPISLVAGIWPMTMRSKRSAVQANERVDEQMALRVDFAVLQPTLQCGEIGFDSPFFGLF